MQFTSFHTSAVCLIKRFSIEHFSFFEGIKFCHGSSNNIFALSNLNIKKTSKVTFKGRKFSWKAGRSKDYKNIN
jgi:hypothetical protein